MVIETHIDSMYRDFEDIAGYLVVGSPSLYVTANEAFRKNLLIASASYFEETVKGIILDFVQEVTHDNDQLIKFVDSKVLARGYHGLFSWDRNNANQFWGAFGLRNTVTQKIARTPQLSESIQAFMELGRERNNLVHRDFGTFPLDKTATEIYELYRKALEFVEVLPELLRSTN